MTWASIDVVRDAKGIRLAAIEVLEESFERGRIEHAMAGANEDTRGRLLASVSRPSSAAGYLRWCDHLWALEAQGKAGISLAGITAFEAAGLVAIAEARREWEFKHPECSRCKARQSTRFGTQCEACKAKFAGRK